MLQRIIVFALSIFFCAHAADIPATTHVLVRAIIIHDNHLLCAYDPKIATNNVPLFYHLPGGHLQYNQNADECLLSHLKKHFDLTIEIQHCVGAFERSWDTAPKSITCHKHEVTLVFIANLKDMIDINTPIQSKKPEFFGFEWIPLEKIASLDIRPHVIADMLPTWINNQNTFLASQMHIIQ